eukprot:g35867.t1
MQAIGLYALEVEYEVLILQFACGIIRAQMLHETVPESALGLTDVEEAVLGATDTVDQVGEYTGEPLSNVESLLWALNGGDRDVAVEEGEGSIGDGPGEFEVQVKDGQDVHVEDEILGARELEEVEGMSGVLNVGGEFLDSEGEKDKDRVK